MARLRHLHAEAGHLAATVSDFLAHPEVSRAMEQALMHIMVRCLAEGLAAGTSSRHPRQPVMRRFEEFLEDNLDRAIYLQEICAAIGVQERTLRSHCEDHLGMGPRKYLWLRRMHLARRRLTRTDPTAATVTVTAIALAHGFGELGRFAVQYRKLFGESPSATLRRASK
jgi:AraC-like DNA-binding protein